jgi:predicted glycoside hydrolase/deacetylase ChbG (UPF0249 family)
MTPLAAIPAGLIVNADDFGIHPNINAGIISAYLHGIVTSTTMLVTTRFFEQTIREASSTNLPVGIHLSLTLGKARARIEDVPDLVDADGNFTWSSRRLHFYSFGYSERRVAEQIRREFAAQLALARDSGLRLTHADSHQHVHMNPVIFQIVEDLLPRYGVTRLRYCRERVSPRLLATFIARGRYINAAKFALLRSASRRIRPRLSTPDSFFGVLYSGRVTYEALRAVISSLSKRHSFEICIHPGIPVPNTEALYPSHNENAFISSPFRQLEHDALTNDEVSFLVRQHGLVLRSFDGVQKPI